MTKIESGQNDGLVKFEIADFKGEKRITIDTRFSDYMKWAVGWFNDSTIVAYSSDIGNIAWSLEKGRPVQAEVSKEMDQFATELYQKKYDPNPRVKTP